MTGRRQNANISSSRLKRSKTSQRQTKGHKNMINLIAMTAKVQRERAVLTLSMLSFFSSVILLLLSSSPGRAPGNGAMPAHQPHASHRAKQLSKQLTPASPAL